MSNADEDSNIDYDSQVVQNQAPIFRKQYVETKSVIDQDGNITSSSKLCSKLHEIHVTGEFNPENIEDRQHT